ncbi:hypothetical protein AAZX31_17G073300 [Glycine max]|uniref:Secreted protein n=1 Tax=Glycine max TaxID=3847 RepID=C6TFX7_SOYBN|nr:uncharacterized protein LOC100790683 precursor [Glycine max]KAG4932545.1 hypothetical protein JHK87_046547 [Glycine soja]ACU20729.1 unknown [Glycine max]KAG4929793.1 hypothetical protein JHK86_046754 [Glycine max]KAG4942673.1 hypothetical protein JHK85_047319 [Glycine max]KAG5097010.1 hypothetical protein JHK82_046864 [Glycine max]|eukprot:NP_001241078.1 uncharacterized protein LOC100790683 precursor [Glycine max]
MNILLCLSLSLSLSRSLTHSLCHASCYDMFLSFSFYATSGVLHSLSYLSLTFLTLRGCEDGFGVWTRWIRRRQTSSPVARQRYRFFDFVAAIHGGVVF